MSNQGIYKITIADKFHYYGQSVNLERRRSEHLSHLKNDNHHNKFMQRVYNKYLDFSFEIIEEVEDTSLLDSREQYYIDLHIEDANCMNLAKFAGSPNRGRILSKEHVARRAASKSKQIKVTYPNGYFDIFLSAKEAALKFGVHSTTISFYCTGKSPQPGTGIVRNNIKHIHGYVFKYVENIIPIA